MRQDHAVQRRPVVVVGGADDQVRAAPARRHAEGHQRDHRQDELQDAHRRVLPSSLLQQTDLFLRLSSPGSSENIPSLIVKHAVNAWSSNYAWYVI